MAPQDAKAVLVTGVSHALGERLARRFAADRSIERVIGVDVAPPRADLGRTEFVRADIRNPIIAKVIASADVDTVVHLSVVATPLTAGGRSAMKEINVIGTMQLLAACQKSRSVRRLVVRSSTTVYGSSPRDPALFTEDMEPRSLPRTGFSKDVLEIESYVRGFGRRRPDVGVTMLRFASIVGPTVDTPFAGYFALPVVPTVLGYDARLQFVHEDDTLEVLHLAATGDRPGTFNVAGDGVLLLSQAVRRAGRVPAPVPAISVSWFAQVLRRAGVTDFSPEQLRYLTYGRAVDTTRLRTQFGYTPRWSTATAFQDFVTARAALGRIDPELVRTAEQRLAALLGSRGLGGLPRPPLPALPAGRARHG